MKFERESWRKLYVAESVEHRRLPLFTRGLRDYLLRVAQEDGTIFGETDDAAGDLAAALNAAPAERKLLDRAVSDLIKIGYLSFSDKRLWVTRFVDAQQARSPGAKRQAAYKQRHAKSSPGDVSGDASGDVSKESRGDASVTSQIDETRRDETTAPNPTAVGPCPADLALLPEQRKTLVSAMIPEWAIDAITLRFVGKNAGSASKPRTLDNWRRTLAVAVQSDWADGSRRPKKPDEIAPTDETGGYGKASDWS